MRPLQVLLALACAQQASCFLAAPSPRPTLLPAATTSGAATTSTQPAAAPTSLTQRILESLPQEAQAAGAGGATTWQGLQRLDEAWSALRNMKTGEEAGPAPVFVSESAQPLGVQPEYDVVVCGGTIGIFMATALQLKGWRVCVIERGALQGRMQEWNVSEQELDEVIAEGVFAPEDKKDIIGIKFNPMRAGFKRKEGDPGGVDTYCPDVLNLGVKPSVMVQRARARFEAAGGTVMEGTAIAGVRVHPDGARVDVGGGGGVTGRLVLDCMGNGSPMVRQARWGRKPDGMCLVVGCCARGFEPEANTAGDIIYANTPVLDQGGGVGAQYFWEAFPAGSGPGDRTIYMFQYLDAHPARPSLHSMLEDFWRLMPEYQGKSLDDLAIQRVLFGMFSTYKDSPLPSRWARVCQIGDAGGCQSPLSFGGFASLSRHIGRVSRAFDEALRDDVLDRDSLAAINAYQPNLASTWMFQKSMSVEVGESIRPTAIVDLMAANFKSMDSLGVDTLKPFLQDVVQFGPLLRILVGVTVSAPLAIPPLLAHVGVRPIAEWFVHFIRMGLYTAAHNTLQGPVRAALPLMDKAAQFRTRRMLDAWEFGSGLDYTYQPPEQQHQQQQEQQ